MSLTIKGYIPRWTLIGALMVIASALRWWNLGKASIWHDEGFSVMLAQLPITEIFERTARDVHPPLYYLVLHYWMNIFGHSEVGIRSLSLVCTVLLVPLVYCMVRRLWNERGAQLAAVLVCLGPMLVRYGQETRMYGLVALLAAAATYCLVRAMEYNRLRWWIAYAAFLSAAMYTHYYTIFILPALFAYVLHVSRKQHGGWENYRWWLSNLGALAIFAPWLPSAWDQFSRAKHFDWIPLADGATLPNYLFHLLAFGYPASMATWLKLALGCFFIACIALAWKKAGSRRPILLFFGIYAFAGPLLVYFASFSGSPFLERYFIYAAVGFYCLLALMITLLGRRMQLAAIAGILVLFGIGSYNINADYTHDMRSAGAYVNQNYRPGDYLLSDVMLTYFDFSYYNRTNATVHVWQEGGIDGYGELSLLYGKDELVVRNLEDIQPPSGKIWVISKADKTGSRGHLPANWRMQKIPKLYADNLVLEYTVLPRSQK